MNKEAAASEKKLVYLIHKHWASHLHYDLRLEQDGVLKSFALPKEPPVQPGEKRLAVQVEDHPLSYAEFEGTIPEGQYGAGKVEIWDRGHYRLLAENENMKEILICGKKLKGVYSLIKFRDKNKEKRGQNLWLFFKNKDQSKAVKAKDEEA
ncbi:MAG: DNA polymerase ligase N-terminal domain-containing protein [Candidatus Saccharicenans sp.]